MAEHTNGRLKIDPHLLLVGAAQLIALGIATGVLIGRLNSLEARVTSVAASSVTRSEVALALSAAHRENDLIWDELKSVKEQVEHKKGNR